MSSGTYRDQISAAYQGELVGEYLYRGLAERAANPDQKAKLAAIANVERLTHGRLRPIAERLGITATEAEWRPVVERRAKELGSMSWPHFIEEAVRDWPPYIARFEALLVLAPAGDATSIQLLVDHEVALVEFVRLEKASLTSGVSRIDAQGFDASMQVLESFLNS
jgi:hypothetical protein